MHNEKEQEMTSPVNHSEDTQNIIQGEEFIDDDLDSQTLGNARGNFIFSSYIFVSNSFLLDVHFHFSFFFSSSFSAQIWEKAGSTPLSIISIIFILLACNTD